MLATFHIRAMWMDTVWLSTHYFSTSIIWMSSRPNTPDSIKKNPDRLKDQKRPFLDISKLKWEAVKRNPHCDRCRRCDCKCNFSLSKQHLSLPADLHPLLSCLLSFFLAIQRKRTRWMPVSAEWQMGWLYKLARLAIEKNNTLSVS